MFLRNVGIDLQIKLEPKPKTPTTTTLLQPVLRTCEILGSHGGGECEDGAFWDIAISPMAEAVHISETSIYFN
jgi:hypothetical protein